MHRLGLLIVMVVILVMITRIGKYAFTGCSSLSTINIPSSVTSIEGDAFLDCSSLSIINIPSSVTGIGIHSFRGCTTLAALAKKQNRSIVEFIRCRDVLQLRYSILLSLRYLTLLDATEPPNQRRRLLEQEVNPILLPEQLNGKLAYNMLTIGEGEIWREILKFI